MHIFIITGGRIDNDFALSYIKNQKPDAVIGADRGLMACYKMGIMPDVILGDFDSVDETVLAYYKEQVPERIRQFPAQKDETDTELALREAIKRIHEDSISQPDAKKCITILGATGTRLDHVLGNLQLLKLALDQGISCQIVDNNNRIRLIDHDFAIKREEQFGSYISFLPFTEQVEGITLRGFAYDVKDWTMTSGIVRGVSNEIQDSIATISLKKGILIMVESRD